VYESTTPPTVKLSHVKLGSDISVKFTLKDADNIPVNNGVATLYLAMQTGPGVWGVEIEATPDGNSNDGNQFRNYAGKGQYIYNLNTKPLSIGTWQLRVRLNDGTTQTMTIKIVK
jgi:hypothetical protein